MKKQFLIIAMFILVAYSWNTYAQNNEITISPLKNNTSTDGEINTFMHKDSKGNYIFSSSAKDGLLIKKTDSNLNTLSTYLLSNNDGSESGSYSNEGLVFIKDKIWILRKYKEKKSDLVTMKARSLNPEKLSPEGDWSQILNYDKSKYEDPNFYSSKNNQSFISSIRATSDDKEADCVIKISSYDANFKQLWSTDKKFPFKDNVTSVISAKTDDDGNFYLLIKVYRKHGKFMNLDRDDGKINFDLHMIVLSNKSESMLDYTLAFKTNIIPATYDFCINTKGDLVVAGYYTTDIDNCRVQDNAYTFDQNIYGSFYFNLDTKANKIKSASFDPFGKEILALDLKTKDAEKMSEQIKAGETGKAGIDYLSFNTAELMDDGSLYFIGQKGFSIERKKGYSSVYDYYYQGIMLIQYDNSGKATAKTLINKRQYSFEDNAKYLSFFFCRSKNNFYFYYNDLMGNLTLSNLYDMKEFQPRSDMAHIGKIGNAEDKQIICLAEVDKTGKLTKVKALENKADGDLLSRYFGVDFKDGNYILTTIGKDNMSSYLLKVSDY